MLGLIHFIKISSDLLFIAGYYNFLVQCYLLLFLPESTPLEVVFWFKGGHGFQLYLRLENPIQRQRDLLASDVHHQPSLGSRGSYEPCQVNIRPNTRVFLRAASSQPANLIHSFSSPKVSWYFCSHSRLNVTTGPQRWRRQFPSEFVGP